MSKDIEWNKERSNKEKWMLRKQTCAKKETTITQKHGVNIG